MPRPPSCAGKGAGEFLDAAGVAQHDFVWLVGNGAGANQIFRRGRVRVSSDDDPAGFFQIKIQRLQICRARLGALFQTRGEELQVASAAWRSLRPVMAGQFQEHKRCHGIAGGFKAPSIILHSQDQIRGRGAALPKAAVCGVVNLASSAFGQ